MNGFRSDKDVLIHAVYLSVFQLPIPTKKKCPIMGTLFGIFQTNWRVVGVTVEALELLAKDANDYRYRKGICRAHIFDRYHTAQQLFDRIIPADLEEFFAIVWINDRTVLATKNENKLKGTLPEIIPIPASKNLFPSRQVGFRHGRDERDFLREVHGALIKGEVKLVDPYAASW